jgi:hypothetical protein
MKHDGLVLTLLRQEALNALQSLRRSDLAWIVAGGCTLLAYGGIDIVDALLANAATLRNAPWLWLAGLPASAALLGCLLGFGTVRLALSRAYTPFMKALPLSERERQRMTTIAAVCVGAGLSAVVAGFTGVACVLIGKPLAHVWSILTLLSFAAGFGSALVAPRRVHRLPRYSEKDHANHGSDEAQSLFSMHVVDRARPMWVASWAWNIPAGKVIPSWLLVAAGLAAGLTVLASVVGSFARHQVAPGAMTGLFGGLTVFMLALRYHPLGSPILRTAPIGFLRAWLRLLSLPLQLSALFFLVPAGAALAADPSGWPALTASGVWLLMLDVAYAVFAGYFATSPLTAAFSYGAAIAYAAYESSDYGRTVVLGFIALVIWLFYRTRRRFYHG